ncbi:H+ Antiporter protein [Mycobacteroides abscessus subsp. bolletii]|nr:H+ Antiporter protein [Mycobacteroides abscessus subsp. bolletii]
MALPLIVLQTTASPLSVGAVPTATAVPALLVELRVGVMIDQINRRTCSIIAALVSAAASVAIPLVDLAAGLTMGWVVALVILGLSGDVPGYDGKSVLCHVPCCEHRHWGRAHLDSGCSAAASRVLTCANFIPGLEGKPGDAKMITSNTADRGHSTALSMPSGGSGRAAGGR